MRLPSMLRQLLTLCAISLLPLLSACTPTYDWREVHGATQPFYAYMPGKTSEYTRPVQLGPLKTDMTMTATVVDGVTFAVGVAQMQNGKQAQDALAMMKEAMLRNIDGKVLHEQNSSAPYMQLQIEAAGVQQLGANRNPVLMLARFVAVENRIYQVLVLGSDRPKMREAADTFLTSFKPT